MAIKFGTNNVNDVVWKDVNSNDKTVTAVKLNGVFVYARKGIYSIGTPPLGVSALVATRTAAIEPTATTNVTIPASGVVFHGDTLNFSVTPSSDLWAVTCTNPTVTLDFLTTTTADGVSLSGVTSTPKSRTIHIITDAHAQYTTVSYYLGTNPQSITYNENTTEDLTVDAPYDVSWQTTYETDWTGTTAGTIAAGLETETINVVSSGVTPD